MFRRAESPAAPKSAVTCKGCQGEITFVTPRGMPPSIAVLCPTCGRRKIYSKEDVRAPLSPEKQGRASIEAS